MEALGDVFKGRKKLKIVVVGFCMINLQNWTPVSQQLKGKGYS